MASMFLEPYALASLAARSFVLLILTACIAFAFRRRSAAVLHGIWAVGLGGCLGTPIVMMLSPSWNLPLLPPEASAVSTTTVLSGSRQPTATAGNAPHAVNGSERTMGYRPPATPPEIGITPTATSGDERTIANPKLSAFGGHVEWPSLGSVALLVWMAGFLALVLRLFRTMVSMRRTLVQASNLDDANWCKQRDITARLLGVRANVALKQHSGAVSPMVVGLYRPVVLLPDDADTWSHERRRLVLLHELAHVQRHDVLTQTMATLACAVYWFNPLAWWAAIQMKRLREIACDDAVVTHSSVPANYANAVGCGQAVSLPTDGERGSHGQVEQCGEQDHRHSQRNT